MTVLETVRAEVPEGWSDPEQVDMLFALLVLGGIPLLLFAGIFAMVYLPAVIRGEQVKPGAPEVQDQWLGGPRRPAGELTSAAPTGTTTGHTGTTDVGGASGRW